MILVLIFLGLFIWLIVTIKGNTDAHRYPGKTKEEIKDAKTQQRIDEYHKKNEELKKEREEKERQKIIKRGK